MQHISEICLTFRQEDDVHNFITYALDAHPVSAVYIKIDSYAVCIVCQATFNVIFLLPFEPNKPIKGRIY